MIEALWIQRDEIEKKIRAYGVDRKAFHKRTDQSFGFENPGLKKRIRILLDVLILKHFELTISQCVPIVMNAHRIKSAEYAKKYCNGGFNKYDGEDAMTKAKAQRDAMSDGEKRGRYEQLTVPACDR